MQHAIYKREIESAKLKFWTNWLENLDEDSIWKAHKVVNGEPTNGGATQIPTLISPDTGHEVASNNSKSKALFKIFFPVVTVDEQDLPEMEHLPPAFNVEEITDKKISHAIHRLKPFKAPGLNGIQNVVLMCCADLIIPFLGPIYRATFELKVYPERWKTSTTIILKKPGKSNYTVLKAYRLIALMDTMSKVLSSCVADTIMCKTEELELLPRNHFGGRPGRTTTDALHLMVSFIKDNWRKGNVVSALFLDVKAAFPSVTVPRLLYDLRERGVPVEYIDWI